MSFHNYPRFRQCDRSRSWLSAAARQRLSLSHFIFSSSAGQGAVRRLCTVAPKATKRSWWWWSQRSKFTRLRFSSAVCLAVCPGFRQSGVFPQSPAAHAVITVSASHSRQKARHRLTRHPTIHTAAGRRAYRVESSAVTGQRSGSAKEPAHTTGHIASNQTRESTRAQTLV